MKVLVCGSRGWKDREVIRNRLELLPKGSRIIHGGAEGADMMAGKEASRLHFWVSAYFPDYETHGKRAPLLRNNKMLDQKPDLVLCFWDGKSPGTRYTLARAKRLGIPVEVVSSAGP